MKTTDKKRPVNTDKTKLPSTFELASLATTIQQQMPNGFAAKRANVTDRCKLMLRAERPAPRFQRAVDTALELWRTAEATIEKRLEADRQLGELKASVLGAIEIERENGIESERITADHWRDRLAAHKGPQSDIDAMLDYEVIETEKVRNALFKDKRLTVRNKSDFLVNLIGFAAKRGMVFSDGQKMCEPHEAEARKSWLQVDGSGNVPYITLRMARHLFEARQEQLRFNRESGTNLAKKAGKPRAEARIKLGKLPASR